MQVHSGFQTMRHENTLFGISLVENLLVTDQTAAYHSDKIHWKVITCLPVRGDAKL